MPWSDISLVRGWAKLGGGKRVSLVHSGPLGTSLSSWRDIVRTPPKVQVTLVCRTYNGDRALHYNIMYRREMEDDIYDTVIMRACRQDILRAGIELLR